jgi:DNA helicase-2/ATP-dependent DNA helicase PcrA
MTRAKDDLHLLMPQRFFVHGQHSKGDRHMYASRTRFITEALLPNFERPRRLGLPLPAKRLR